MMPTGMYERTKEHNRKNSEAQKGKHLSEITKEKIGKSRIGKKHSQESREKMAKRGDKHPNWKGGQFTDGNGYIHVLMPEHPRADRNGYVSRTHLVAEKILGRYLYPEENTHHKNGIRDDDRPENIDVMTRGEHTYLHNKQRRINKSKTL